MEHENNFDLLRLFAASQVVYLHSVFHLQLPRGGMLFDILSAFPGVTCFFIISGFLVSKSWLDSSPAAYVIKRALRIYPALIANIAVLDLAMYLTGGFLQPVQWLKYPVHFILFAASASDYFADGINGVLFYGRGFFNGYPSGVLWTLTVELSFYAVLPIPLEIYRRSKLAGAIVLAAMMIGSFLLDYGASEQFRAQHPLLNVTVPFYFWIFGIGIAARMLWPWLDRVVRNRMALWLPAYLVLDMIISMTVEMPPGGLLYLDTNGAPTMVTALRVCLLALALLSCAYSFPRASRVLCGYDLSYAIYLYHMLVVTTLASLGVTGTAWLWPVIYGASAAIAWLSWRYIEAPALRAKRAVSAAAAMAFRAVTS